MYILLALSKNSTTCKPSNLKGNIVPKSTHLAQSLTLFLKFQVCTLVNTLFRNLSIKNKIEGRFLEQHVTPWSSDLRNHELRTTIQRSLRSCDFSFLALEVSASLFLICLNKIFRTPLKLESFLSLKFYHGDQHMRLIL